MPIFSVCGLKWKRRARVAGPIRWFVALALLLLPMAAAAGGEDLSAFGGNGASTMRSLEQANAYLHRKDYGNARMQAEIGLASSPFYIPLWLVKAKAEIGLLNYAAATEALEIVLEAEPDNVEANVLAFKVALETSEVTDLQKRESLVRQMQAINPEVFPTVLQETLLSVPDMSLKMDLFMSAWLTAGIGPDVARNVLDKYNQQKFMEAAEILSSASAKALPENLAGALNLALGRILPWVNQPQEALARLAKAKSLGFEVAETGRLIGLIHLVQGEPGKAAAAWEEVWRGSPRPADIALNAAIAYTAAGEPEKAVALIDAAQKAYPNHAGLQARKIMALRRIGDAKRLEAYAAELKARGAVPGLTYASALIDWESKDFDGYARETAAIREYLDRFKGEYMTLTSIDHWVRFGDWVESSDDTKTAQNLSDISNKLWNMGKYADAIVIREERANLGASTMTNTALYNTALNLLDRDMASQAKALLIRNVPEIGGMDLAIRLYDAGRVTAAYRILQTVDENGEGDEAWVKLYLATIAVLTGEREDAHRYMEELWNMSPPASPLYVKSVAEDDDVAVTIVPYSRFQAMALEVAVKAIQDNGYIDMYDAMERAAILQGPGPDGKDQLTSLAAIMVRMGQRDEARRILEAKLAANPGDAAANLYMALAAYGDKQQEQARQYLAAGVAGDGYGAMQEYMKAWQSRLAADQEATVAHLLAAVELDPADPYIRSEAIQALVDNYRYAEARDLVRPFEAQYARDDTDMGSFVAMAYVARGQLADAEPIWGGLVRRFPYSRAPLAGLGDTLNLIEQPRKTIKILSAQAHKTPTAEYSAILAEAHLSLGEAEEAMNWVELGRALAPEDTRLLRLGAESAEMLQNDPVMEYYASEYLALDPNSPGMHSMFGQALLNQKKWEELRCHNIELLKANCLNLGAMERESERLKANEDLKKAAKDGWMMDKQIVQHYSNDPSLVIRGAISAASDSDFRFAIPTLQCMMALGPNSVTQALYFGRIATGNILGGVPMSEVKEKLEALYERHCHAPIDSLALGPNPNKKTLQKIPMVIFVGRSSVAALKEFDKFLSRNNGRAVLVVGQESMTEQTAVWPDAEFLRTLSNTGRWQFVLTDYSPPLLPGKGDTTTNFWLQAKWLGDRFETQEEMRQRLSCAMADLKAKAEMVGIPICGWVHPSWGDYGQRALCQTLADAATYRAAVAEHFTLAMTITPTGYRVPGTDYLRVPMRAVGAGVDTQEFIDSVHWFHPTRRSVMELAKAKSWHGQLPAARNLFIKSRSMGLDTKEIAYFQARNAEYEGDVPSAVNGSHEALNLDPANERNADLWRDAHRLMRPLLTLDPVYTFDSDDERYFGMNATGSWHYSKKLELRVMGGLHHWWNEDGGNSTGESIGVGARYYFAPENWILGEVRGVHVNNGVGTYPEARLQWHGAYDFRKFFLMNGFFDFTYTREAVQTERAMEAGGIFADRFVASTTARICNWWEVDASGGVISRSDGNETWEVMFRPTYRLFDSPLLRIGYWFAAADSKFDPPEYYAPMEYISHSAVAIFRYNLTRNFAISGLGSYGIGRDENNDWHDIFRASLGLNWRISDCVSLSGGWQYLKLPDYWLHQFGGSLGIRF